MCHGHAGGTRPGQTRKTPKDLSAHESEDRGRGESVGLYAVYMHERGGGGRGGCGLRNVIYDRCRSSRSPRRDSLLFIMNR